MGSSLGCPRALEGLEGLEGRGREIQSRIPSTGVLILRGGECVKITWGAIFKLVQV